MRKRVIFYNPKAPYYTLPLQFLALAAVLDHSLYDVQIIDARIEKSVGEAHNKVIELLDGAACVAISVITGTPIADAMDVSRIVHRTNPGVPVVWGGWHPSVFPEQCIMEGGADYCVIGQGEITFRELLETLAAGSGFSEIAGLGYLQDGRFRLNEERRFTDINTFPPYDYGALPLERYFRLKKRRQLDFYSSQGCPYRCSFCADPFVYKRRWSGLESSRMLTDVLDAVRKHRIEDVVFQDENFFAHGGRVLEFCRGMEQAGLPFSWTATSRADQIAPLNEDMLRELSHSGLRELVIGAESGSPAILERIRKDTLVEETIISAEKLARHGIGAAFGFIVGFPDERWDETMLTLETIKRLKRISPEFEANIFFFTPYPGTELFAQMVTMGYSVPTSIHEWSRIDFITYAGYWLGRDERRHIERFRFYSKIATEQNFSIGPFRPLRQLSKLRYAHDEYRFPIEMYLMNLVRHTLLRRVSW